MDMETSLEKAIRVSGGQTALARALTRKLGRVIKQGQIWKWTKSPTGGPPAQYVRAIAEVTREFGQPVTVYELRPDVFGDVPQRCPCIKDGAAA
jgi:DNA-binding transcriptional regulator YdaS (Cro superfamily)